MRLTHLIEIIARRPTPWTSILACICTHYVTEIDQIAADNGWTLSKFYNGTSYYTYTAVHRSGRTVTVRPAEYQHICSSFLGYS